MRFEQPATARSLMLPDSTRERQGAPLPVAGLVFSAHARLTLCGDAPGFFRFRLAPAVRSCRRSAELTAAEQRDSSRAGVMAATDPGLATVGSTAMAREREEGAGGFPQHNPAGSSSTPEAPTTAAKPSSPNASIPETIPPGSAAASAAQELPLDPPPLASAPLSEAAPRTPLGPGGSRPGPETFRQRFRQFRYQDAAGPREAFRQLRELSRQWLRPDIRTKEQIVEMLVQEQLLAIMPEALRARRLRRRTDVRITG